jgi:hypothetical protein
MLNIFGEDSKVEKNKQNKIFTTLGASNHVEHDRQVSDFYATDPKSLITLLETGIKLNHKIWEPCCGQGHLSEVLKANGYEVKSTDLVDRGYGTGDVNFLYEYEKWDGDILTNPPYGIAQEIVEHALDLIPEGNKVIMFLKITFLEGKNRRKMFNENPPRNIYVFSERQVCAMNGDFIRYGNGSAVCYAWFEWIKGYKGKPEITWI